MLILALVLASALQTGPQGDRDELRRLQREAIAAHEKKDYAAFLAVSRAIAARAPRSNRALYNLACAHALAGDAKEALELLDRLARRGVAFDLSADADFAALRELPAFLAIVQKMKALSVPVGSSAVAFTLPDKTLITEGIAYDPKRGDFYVSSIHRRKIVRFAKDGRVSDFCAPGEHGFFAVVGLAVDSARDVLWASSSASPNMDGFRAEDKGRSFVAELDLKTGALRRKLMPPAGVPDAQLSDIALSPKGDLAVADPMTGRVYLLPAGASELGVLIDRGAIDSAQGMAFSPDGRFLFVADYGQGIVKIDVAARSARLLDAPADAAMTGIDGLVWANGSLVGIQNGIRPHRVVRLRLDGALSRVEELSLLERGHPSFDEPTLGVRVGSDFYYVANSQYGNVKDDGTLVKERLEQPAILRMRLPWAEPSAK